MYVCWTYTAKLYVVHAKGGSRMIYFFHWPLQVLGCTSVFRSWRLILVKFNYQGDRKILSKSKTFLMWPFLTSKRLLRLNQKKMLIRVHIFMTIRKIRLNKSHGYSRCFLDSVSYKVDYQTLTIKIKKNLSPFIPSFNSNKFYNQGMEF